MRYVQGMGVTRVMRGVIDARHDGGGIGGRVLQKRVRRVERKRRMRRMTRR